METWYYEVVSIDGDYANLKRTDIESPKISGKSTFAGRNLWGVSVEIWTDAVFYGELIKTF